MSISNEECLHISFTITFKSLISFKFIKSVILTLFIAAVLAVLLKDWHDSV